MTDIQCIVDCHNKLGETPVWDGQSQKLCWVDIEGAKLQCFDPADKALTDWDMPERIVACALRRDGGFVVALASGIAFFDTKTGKLERKAAPEAGKPYVRLNEGKCDRQGRFWIGGMDERQTEGVAGLYRFDPDGSCRQMESGIGVSNGIAWSPDNRLFYFTDSMRKRIYAYDFEPESGAIANRRVFFDWSDRTGTPDGATVDADGYLWSAIWDGWCLTRFAPDGTIDRKVELPVKRPTSAVFGGPELTTLYVTSAIFDTPDEQLKNEPQAGGLFGFDAGVVGLPEPRFAG